ncbi:von Willebrand factor type A domain-containing protein [Aspergillus unguis]
MALVPGILFPADEPPNPHLDDHAWTQIQTKSLPQANHARIKRLATGAYFVDPGRISRDDWHPPPQGQPRTALLPPSSVSLSISVTQGMAKTTATQTFRNDSSQVIEKGTYQFPLPHESSIVDFKCQIGTDKAMQGIVKPKTEARSEFESTISKGRSAGLVEQNSPEVFKTEIGNIPPQTTVEVQISFIFFLKYRLADDITTTLLTLPTYIAPRYGNPEFDVNKTGPSFSTRLSLDISVLASNEIQNIHSDTHQISIERGIRQRRCQRWAEFVADPPLCEQQTAASVKLDGDNACLDRDFVLSIFSHPSVNEDMPHATLELHPELEGSSALMVDIPPAFMLRDQKPMEDREIIFLADRSGSMRDKIAGLMSSMQFFLRGLHDTRFNLYCFGSTYESLWESSQEYGDDTLDEALTYVAGFTNNMGGTELLPALNSVIESRGKGSADIIVLTDGEVWRLKETLQLVRRTHTLTGGAVRFFALGIGNAVSQELVEGIAKAGGGYSEVVPLGSTNSWEAQMVAVLQAAMTGHVTNIDIEIEGVNLRPRYDTLNPPSIQMSPKDITSISPFQRNRIFILSEESQLHEHSQIKIKRTSIRGQRIETIVPVQRLQEKDSTIHKFAARALLADLDQGASWIQISIASQLWPTESEDLTRAEGERLGCKHSLVSKWTSFVAVEKDEQLPSRKMEHAVMISPAESADDDMDLLVTRRHFSKRKKKKCKSAASRRRRASPSSPPRRPRGEASLSDRGNPESEPARRGHMSEPKWLSFRKIREPKVQRQQDLEQQRSPTQSQGQGQNPQVQNPSPPSKHLGPLERDLGLSEYDSFMPVRRKCGFGQADDDVLYDDGLREYGSGTLENSPSHYDEYVRLHHKRSVRPSTPEEFREAFSIQVQETPTNLAQSHSQGQNPQVQFPPPPNSGTRRGADSPNHTSERYLAMGGESDSYPSTPEVHPREERASSSTKSHAIIETCAAPARLLKRPSSSRVQHLSESETKEQETQEQSTISQGAQTQDSFIRHILQFQRADGAFKMTKAEVEGLQQAAGCDVYAVVEALVAEGADFNVAVTLVLVVLLRLRFWESRGLWSLMADKARTFVTQNEADCKPSLWGLADDLLGQAN